ncbi:DUF4192 domain-containing protein [Cellulomonas sp. HZM]|uniref:DUF4192 domain-containing protein n=1 Tax=Cellulomonas sp. HZM TaxID=1454010 RepID=UPI00049314D2|nr:DUF4192 domain-containing protein [Cellulomonas sp. HZM]
MDTETLRVNEPRELLALIPHRLGFRPRESVVVVGLREPRGRVGLVMRVDLEHLADPVAGPQVARSVVSLMDRDRAARLRCAVYDDGPDPRYAPGRLVQAVAHLRDAAHAPFGEVEVHVVTPTGYLDLDCRDMSCCPAGGRPLWELDATQVGARMVLAGSVVAESREALGRIGRASTDRRRSVARVRRRWEARGAAATSPGELAAWRLAGLSTWRDAVEIARDEGEPGLAHVRWGRLEAALADRRVRDAVLVSLIPGTDDLAERSVAAGHPEPADDAAMGSALRRVIDADVGVAPDHDEAVLHRRVLEHVVAHGRAGAQAPALTLLALLAWWAGEGARCAVLLETALRHDDDYRLGHLLQDLLEHGVGPGWTRV